MQLVTDGVTTTSRDGSHLYADHRAPSPCSPRLQERRDTPLRLSWPWLYDKIAGCRPRASGRKTASVLYNSCRGGTCSPLEQDPAGTRYLPICFGRCGPLDASKPICRGQAAFGSGAARSGSRIGSLCRAAGRPRGSFGCFTVNEHGLVFCYNVRCRILLLLP